MAESVQIKNVTGAKYFSVFVFKDDPTVQRGLRMEVYAGNIVLQAQNHSAPTTRNTYKSYLPLDDEQKIRFYKRPVAEDNAITAVTSVSVAAFALDEDEAGFVAVDAAEAKLEAQTIGEDLVRQLCLILNVRTAILNGTLIRIAYNVTVLTDDPRGLGPADFANLTDNSAPEES